MKTIKEATKILKDLGVIQQQGHAAGLLCPRCGKQTMSEIITHNALSRSVDVYICDLCGMEEALAAFTNQPALPLNEWSIIRGLENSTNTQEDKDDTI